MSSLRSMLCPGCRSPLVPGEEKRYETLGEHICDPNGTRSEKPTVICKNESCFANFDKSGGIYWAHDGEGPYNTSFRYDEGYAWIDRNPNPLGSWHRGTYFQIYYHEEDRRFSLGRLTILREIKYRSNENGDKVGRQVSYRIIWAGTYWHSGLNMLLFELKSFYRCRDHGKQIMERAKWPRAEWWRKAAAWWIRSFHRKAVS